MGLRKGKSTEQLLKHLTERWREAIERKLFLGILFVDLTKAFDMVSHNIVLQKLNELGIRRDIRLWLIKELPHRKKTIRENQRMRLRYTHCNSRSAARVGPQTHVFSLFTNDLSKSLTTPCGNLSVRRRHKNVLYRRNDGFANKHTKKCPSRTPGMVRQKFDGTTPRKM